jgi:hypothetical protein
MVCSGQFLLPSKERTKNSPLKDSKMLVICNWECVYFFDLQSLEESL